VLSWTPIPFIRFTLALIIGILAKDFLPAESEFFFLSGLALYLILILITQKRQYSLSGLYGALGFIIIIFGGSAIRQNQEVKLNPLKRNDFISSNNHYLLWINNPVEENGKRIKVSAMIVGYGQPGDWNPCEFKTIIYSDTTLKLETDQLYLLKKPPQEFVNFSPASDFDFKKYYNTLGIYLVGHVRNDDLQLMGKRESSRIMRWAKDVKTIVETRLNSGFENKQVSALLKAITIGVKADIDPGVKENFASTGTMHVLAVSGLHVGILYGIFLFFSRHLLKSRFRHLVVLVIIFLLWFYALLTGFTPSVLRAVTMFSILALGKSFRRKSNPYNLVFFSAFLLLILNPGLIYMVGFQLSYMAVLSILLFTPKLMNVSIPFLPHNVKALLAVSISAQLGTFPLSLLYFKQFPVYFLVSNLLVIPLVFILLNGTILYLLGGIFAPLQEFIGYFVGKITQLLLALVKMMGSLPWSTYKTQTFTMQEAVILYLFILSITYFLIRKRFRWLVISFGILLSFTILRTYSLWLFYHS